MIRLSLGSVCEVIRIEDLQPPALEAISLAVEHFRASFVDDPNLNAMARHPDCGLLASGPCAGDEDIY